MMQRSKFRWHYIYYLLAAFDIVTITASLLLSHEVTKIFNESVAVNTVWASRASSITNLNLLVTIANAPGNNVFENGDVEGERARFEETFSTFQSSYETTYREIFENVSQNKTLLIDNLERSYGAVERLAVEARAVFNSIENGNSLKAGRHMATMDRHYAATSKLLGNISNLVLVQQEELFKTQLQSAAFYRQFEVVFAIIIGAIILIVTFYGHIIARKFREIDDDRIAKTSELIFQTHALDEHAIVSIADVKGNITYVNDKFCAISGYNRKELIGSNHRIVKSDEQSGAFWVDMWKTITNGNTWHGEIKNLNKSGEYYWVKTTIVPTLNEDGKPTQYVGIRTEITDRKNSETKLHESEERFRAAFQYSHSIATITDFETGKFVDVNDAWLRLRGFEKHEVIGKTSIELNVWGSNEHRQEIVNELKLRGKLLNHETYAVTKAGETRDTIINGEVVNVQGKKLLFLSGSDVTERNQLEKQLRRSQKMEAVGQLTGGIAHDFNNILGIVLGNLEIIGRLPPGDKRIADRMDVARKAVGRGADITRKLLGFSRKDPHEVQLVDLNGSITNLLDLITKSLTVSIKVRTYLADDLWTVEIDPGDFEDAILNLALNARDAMPDGGNLTIETQNKTLDKDFVERNTQAETGNFILVSIRDTGEGMSSKVKDRVFEPFFTTKEVGKGTGLGLSMVYGFVERSGGFIIIDSEIGKGTVFNLFMPRAVKNEPDLNESEIATDSQPQGRETILIVDDEEGLREIAAFNLGELGYETLVVEDGPSALKVLEQERDIDLMFSDVVMPNDMNAYELAQKAHKSHPQLKILLTSGYDRKLGEIENSDDPFLIKLNKTQLKKPYSISELAIAIRKALDEGV